MAQEEFYIPTLILNVCYCLAPFHAWFFCNYLDMKIIGISMMRNVCEFTALVCIVYSYFKIEKIR
jgi:hypothetical protein